MPCLVLLAALLLGVSAHAESQPLRIFLRGGPKTHGPGQHDHPRFVEEWTKLLAARGAVVQGELRFPNAAELGKSDVLVIYAPDGASIHGDERANLEAFLARGGGLVVLHDGVCGDDPQWFKTVAGGAWEHGRAKWHEGEIGVYFRDREHAITRGAANFDFKDEIYSDLHMDPAAHVLACGFESVFDDPPQMWTYEKDGYRAFVSLQGHEWTSFSHPAWRTLVLRGIAWAGKRDVDLLTDAKERVALAYPPGGPTQPDAAAAKLHVAPGHELSLVAAEPLVVKPISIDWDARGRMWVAQTPGYPMKSEFSKLPPRDSIVILSDADGDGRMDASRTFCDGLDLVTSFVFHRDGVIASSSPDVLWIRDTDGDGTADAREVLYTGFGYGDTHAVVSNLRWGLDGWIYATQGYSGNASRDVHNAKKRFGPIGNGILRFKPDGSAIEMVSSYSSNTWGLDFTADGELFFSMANGAHARHVVLPESALANGRLKGVETWADIADHDKVFPMLTETREPYLQIDFVGGFTAASGCCIWNDKLYVAEPTVHVVHEDVLAPDGVTFKASKAREAEFLAGADPWFRPVHMRVGPDGALYVLDFYNQAVVHNDTRGPKHGPTNAALRPDRDHDHGRIWRVAAKGALPERIDLTSPSESQLIDALSDANPWIRGTARQMLIAKELSPKATLALAGKLKNPPARGRIEALWVLHGLGLGKGDLAQALWDDDAAVRSNALRIVAADEKYRNVEIDGRIWSLMRDENARVRLDAIVASQAVSAEDRAPILSRCYADAADDWTRSAVVSASATTVSMARCLKAALDSPRRADLTAYIEQLADQSGRHDEGRFLAVAVVAVAPHASSAPRQVEIALRRMGRYLERSRVGPVIGVGDVLAGLLAADDVGVAAAALPFALAWDAGGALEPRIAQLAARLHAMAVDPAVDAAGRWSAAAALLSVPERRTQGLEAARSILDLLTPPEVQLAVIDELGRAGDEAAASVLVARYSELGNAARDAAFRHLIGRSATAGVLLAAIASKSIAANDLGPYKLSQLRNHPDAATAQRASELLDTLQGGAGTQVEELVAKLLPLVAQPGDLARGKELFAQNCGTCHTFRGEGGNVGPALDGIGAHGAESLLPVILDPNRTVEAAYVDYVAETTDGLLVTGVLVRETQDAVVLRSTAGDVEVRRDELESLRSTGRTPMPSGFEQLGAEGLRDVLAYLASGTEGFRVLDLRPFANASGARGLYDEQRDPNKLELARTGLVEIGGVPFEVIDAARAPGGNDAVVLRGGRRPEWQSKRQPRRVEVPVGCAVERVHVLGGIAAWGYPCSQDQRPILKWTWHFADGTQEEAVLRDGVEFADWIGRHEVEGSTWVPDLVAENSAGQVRTFGVAPRKNAVVKSIALESYDNDMAPTFLALTAELAGARPSAASAAVREEANGVEILLFGGGSSHDFVRWFGESDRAALAAADLGDARFSQSPPELAAALGDLDVLVLSANQALGGPDAREKLFDFTARGGGLVLVHPATWYNWADWPEYNARLVGGGTRGHEDYREFEVRVVDARHPLAAGVPRTFRVADELYRFERDPLGNEIQVVAMGHSLATGEDYPVVWTVARSQGRTACITLGHDGAAHEHPAYKTLLANAVRWTSAKP